MRILTCLGLATILKTTTMHQSYHLANIVALQGEDKGGMIYGVRRNGDVMGEVELNNSMDMLATARERMTKPLSIHHLPTTMTAMC